MTEWYLWDGESQLGPMDRRELDNRIRHHPAPNIARVWRDGFRDWKTVQEAFGEERKSALDPCSFEVPYKPQANAKYQNLVARNWRGEFPLWISYWVIGILSNIFVVVVAGLLGALKGSYNPIGILLFIVGLWSFIACLSTWQQVGIWRSANRSIDEHTLIGKRAPWAGLAKFMVCLAWLQIVGLVLKSAIPQISEAVNIAFMDDPDIPSYSIRVMNNGSEAEIAGGIKFGLTTDFEKILNASSGVRVVHLDSIGGRLGEGEKLNALIRARGLDTYVDTKCLSACTLAFVGGRQRILKKGAQLGFHRGAFAGEDQVDDRSGIDRAVYVAAGISAAFVDRALATKHADMWRPSETELLSAGVVTRVSNGDEYALAGVGGNKFTRDDLEKGLQKSAPLYKALKEKYPKSYEEILDVFSDGIARGTPQAELASRGRAKLHSHIKALLPQADDAVLIAFGRLVVDQYRALQGQDKAACYKYASGVIDEAAIRLLPRDLIERELELNAMIISSARNQGAAVKTDASWEKILATLNQRGFTDSDRQMLGGTSISPSNYARFCDYVIIFYQAITNLPAKEAASVLREIFKE
jgi:hypothetical protein